MEPSKQKPSTAPQSRIGPAVMRVLSSLRGADERKATPAMLRPSTIRAVRGTSANAVDDGSAAARKARAAVAPLRA